METPILWGVITGAGLLGVWVVFTVLELREARRFKRELKEIVGSLTRAMKAFEEPPEKEP